MKFSGLSAFLVMLVIFQGPQAQQLNKYYPSGRSPLLAPAYAKLPFGAVRPKGWLETQLNLQANGMTGHIDEFYNPLKTIASVSRSLEYHWCYHEGLMATAYLANDQKLITKAKAAVDYIIGTQTADGNFLGTTEAFDHVAICRGMVEYYEITQDSRVIPFLTNYFHYVNSANLTGNIWSTTRKPEHLPIAYWLYNRTGDQAVLDAMTKSCGGKVNDWLGNYQNFPWTDSASKVTTYPEYVHNVNIGHSFKYALYYLQTKDAGYKDIYVKGLPEVDKYHGSSAGRFNADENYQGKQPTQGMETCGIAEMSFSMMKLFEAFGDIPVADRAEFLVFNCWAGCNTADMWGHQYDQQANQIKVSNENRPWNNNTSTSNLFGREPNYPCCLCNVHQTWPRYIEHMWMATQDNGVVASLYGPSQVTAAVAGDSAIVTITESTEYPFDGKIGFKVTVSKSDSFPIGFRIPAWENQATIQIGGAAAVAAPAGAIYTMRRTWQTDDSVTLTFPMKIRSENRWNRSVSVIRGPLWYSLKIGQTWTKQSSSSNYMGSSDWAISATTAWNVGLKVDPANPNGSFSIVRNAISQVPFAQKGEQIFVPGATGFTTWTQDAPVVLKAQGKILTGWTTNSQYPGNANDPPASPLQTSVAGRDTTVELIPYGSARLRITEFPWINTPAEVISKALNPKKPKLVASAMQNGKYMLTVGPAGAFDLVVLNLAGRAVSRMHAMGPKTVELDKGMLHEGAYIAQVTSGGKKIEEKISIVR